MKRSAPTGWKIMQRYRRRRTILRDGPDPIDAYVGSRLKVLRVGMRIGQTKRGKAAGVSFQQIQNYENVVGDMYA